MKAPSQNASSDDDHVNADEPEGGNDLQGGEKNAQKERSVERKGDWNGLKTHILHSVGAPLVVISVSLLLLLSDNGFVS